MSKLGHCFLLDCLLCLPIELLYHLLELNYLSLIGIFFLLNFFQLLLVLLEEFFDLILELDEFFDSSIKRLRLFLLRLVEIYVVFLAFSQLLLYLRLNSSDFINLQ